MTMLRPLITIIFSSLCLLALQRCTDDVPKVSRAEWIRKANYPGGYNDNATTFVIGKKAYVIDSELLEYDQNTDTWTEVAGLPASSYDMEGSLAFSIGGKGYVGTGGTTSYHNHFWEFDPVTKQWTALNDFPGGARYGAVGFVLGGKGYLIGGDNSEPTAENDPNGMLNDVWEYDPSTDAWTQKNNFGGEGRVEGVSFVVGNLAYVSTGYYVSRENGLGAGNILRDLWEYNPGNDSWMKKADLPEGKERYTAVAFGIGDRGYVATGFNSSNETFGDLWEYSPQTNTWREISIVASSRYDAFAFAIDNRGYIGGGTVANEYDTETRSSFFWELAR